MTDEKDEVTKGFSRLSDLASDVSDINEAVSSEQESGAKPGAKPFSSTQSSSITTTEESCSEAERKSTASPPPIETVTGGGGENTSAKWILGLGTAFVIFIIWAANNGEQSSTNSSDKPPSFSQSRDYPLPSPAPAVPTAPTAQNPSPTDTPNLLIQYEKPPVGSNNVLTFPQICWCIRENIRIEAMRNVTDTDAGIEGFNRIVDDYNGRCGSYRYREGSLETAKRNVEAYRDQIVSEAIRDAGQLGRASQPPRVPAAVDIPPPDTDKRPNAKETEEAQVLLTELGYEPGPIDGDYGHFTSDAIKAFQQDMGVAQDGVIDQNLFALLRKAKASFKPTSVTPQHSSPTQEDNASVPDTGSAPLSSSAYFTRGSSQDDVLRIQGRPDDINDYAALGYRELRYGYSSVLISNRDRCVLSWTNEGNLKVQLQPGPKTTTASFFTRGSHQDDVLRLQGTPDDINAYSALGYEEWKYAYSSVLISNRDRCVLSWTNEGNLKVQLQPGPKTTTASFFTRGSHQDDVLRLQGTPDDINAYSALGYEEWKYGYSSVLISNRDRCVLSWTNEGNLKVQLQPGPKTTTASFFTRGSHQDDVLRLQGTPDDINVYTALGYEEWKYAYSSVMISTQNHKVLSWDSSSGNLRAR